MSGARWKPMRKIVAAALGGVVASGGLAGWSASGSVDWRVGLAGAIGAAVPVVIGYLTPERPSEGTSATAPPGSVSPP